MDPTGPLSAAEPWIRFGVYAALLIGIGTWESLMPRRERVATRWRRWPGNLGVAALNTLIVRILLPTAAIGVAVIAAERGWGLFNIVSVPQWLAVVACVLLLDLVVYLQHVLLHAVPVLWRLHRMHHADLDFDVTTGARFHPLEILLSMGVKVAVVVALGAPALAVLIFEVLLNATSMFNHANLRLPLRLDAVLRYLIVTPDMHRVHHSTVVAETNSNFGFNLPWWDRLFGTYRDQPGAGHVGMSIGLTQFRSVDESRLDKMLTQPFRQDTGPYPMLKTRKSDPGTSG